MVKKRIRAALAILIACLFLQASVPVPTRADTGDTLVTAAIVGGAVTGGIVLIAVVATALTRDDPRFLLQPGPGRPPTAPGGVGLGASCPQTPAGSLAVCW